MPIKYQQTMDREKHKADIQELKRLNFEEYSFFGETVQAFGFIPLGISGFIGTIISLFKEVAKVEGNLDVTIFNVIMASREYATYAGPFGLGVKFYTQFTDGTFVITTDFSSPAIADEQEKIFKYGASQSISSAWLHHRKWVEQICRDDKQKVDHLSFADFLQLSEREDKYIIKHKGALARGESLPSIPSWVIAIALWAAFMLLFMFVPILIHFLYPSCWFVRSMNKPAPVQGILLIFASIVIGWLMARKADKTALIEGAGTKFFGQTPTSNSKEYISTKWLVFMMVSVIPVGTYLITEEHPGRHHNARYSMKLLDKIDSSQVGETLWKSKFGIMLLVVFLLSLGIWSLWECM